jgi:hypothetical protein
VGSQYEHRERPRRSVLTGLVMVVEVLVDDLPQLGIVRVAGQHRPGGNPESLWADVDLNVGVSLQVVVPAGGPGIATVRRRDQVRGIVVDYLLKTDV